MFILYGTKTKLYKKGESIESITCSKCGRVGKWDYTLARKFTTIFFIPICPSPFGKSYYLNCPNCQFGTKITKENSEQMMKLIRIENQTTSQPQPNAAQVAKPSSSSGQPISPSATELYKSASDSYNKGMYDSALKIALQAASLSGNDSNIMYLIGECYRSKNDFEHAKQYYESCGNMGMSDGYARIGYLYMPGTFSEWTISRVNDPAEAIGWFIRSINLLQESQREQIAVRLNNIAVCYERLHNFYHAALYMWTAYRYGRKESLSDYRIYSAKLQPDQIAKIEAVQSRTDLISSL